MLKSLQKRLQNLSHSPVVFSKVWQKNYMKKVTWKTKKALYHKPFLSTQEINSTCSTRRYIRMYVWLPPLLLLLVSLVVKPITGCGPAIQGTSQCSVSMQMPMGNRLNTMQATLLWKLKSIWQSPSKVWKKETTQWLWDSPEEPAVIWPYLK